MNLRKRILQEAKDYVTPTLRVVLPMKNKYGPTKEQKQIVARWRALVKREQNRMMKELKEKEPEWWEGMFITMPHGPKWPSSHHR